MTRAAAKTPVGEQESQEGEATAKPRPAVRHKGLKVTNKAPNSPEKDDESAQDARDEAAVEDREKARKSADKIGQVEGLDHAQYAVDQTVTQCFGMAVIDAYDGAVEKLPRYRFKRWYFGLKVIVDTFRTQREYDAADVENRRALAHKFGHRYAALGPNHSRYPHGDADERRRYPSLTEQLEEKG